jgi:two-component system CheB/CheR fusion protein
VVDKDGHWQLLRIRPYKTQDDRLSGAVLAMVNIDGTRRFQAHLDQSRESFKIVFETVRQPLVLLDPDLHVLAANRAFYETFRGTVKDTEQRPLIFLSEGRWDSAELRALLGRVLAGGSAESLLTAPDVPAGARGPMIVRAQALELQNHTRGVLMVIDDAPEAK